MQNANTVHCCDMDKIYVDIRNILMFIQLMRIAKTLRAKYYLDIVLITFAFCV